MLSCPVCGSKQVEAATKCTVCGAEVAVESARQNEKGATETVFVEIYRAGNETDAQIIRGALEAAGIECVLRGETLRLTHGITADGLAEVRVLVPTADAERARGVIAAAG